MLRMTDWNCQFCHCRLIWNPSVAIAAAAAVEMMTNAVMVTTALFVTCARVTCGVVTNDWQGMLWMMVISAMVVLVVDPGVAATVTIVAVVFVVVVKLLFVMSAVMAAAVVKMTMVLEGVVVVVAVVAAFHFRVPVFVPPVAAYQVRTAMTLTSAAMPFQALSGEAGVVDVAGNCYTDSEAYRIHMADNRRMVEHGVGGVVACEGTRTPKVDIPGVGGSASVARTVVGIEEDSGADGNRHIRRHSRPVAWNDEALVAGREVVLPVRAVAERLEQLPTLGYPVRVVVVLPPTLSDANLRCCGTRKQTRV